MVRPGSGAPPPTAAGLWITPGRGQGIILRDGPLRTRKNGAAHRVVNAPGGQNGRPAYCYGVRMKSQGSVLMAETATSTSCPRSWSTFFSASAAVGSQSHSEAKWETSMRYGLAVQRGLAGLGGGVVAQVGGDVHVGLGGTDRIEERIPRPAADCDLAHDPGAFPGHAHSPGHRGHRGEDAGGELVQLQRLGQHADPADAFLGQPVLGGRQRLGVGEPEDVRQHVGDPADRRIGVGVGGDQGAAGFDEQVHGLALEPGGSHGVDRAQQQRVVGDQQVGAAGHGVGHHLEGGVHGEHDALDGAFGAPDDRARRCPIPRPARRARVPRRQPAPVPGSGWRASASAGRCAGPRRRTGPHSGPVSDGRLPACAPGSRPRNQRVNRGPVRCRAARGGRCGGFGAGDLGGVSVAASAVSAGAWSAASGPETIRMPWGCCLLLCMPLPYPDRRANSRMCGPRISSARAAHGARQRAAVGNEMAMPSA